MVKPKRAPRCACGAPMARGADQCAACAGGGPDPAPPPAARRRKRDQAAEVQLETVVFGVPVGHALEVDRIARAEGVPQAVIWRAIVDWGIVHVRKAQANGAGKLL